MYEIFYLKALRQYYKKAIDKIYLHEISNSKQNGFTETIIILT